jgi:lysophospholipase L1-like esterase
VLANHRVLVIGDSNLFESGATVDAALRDASFDPTLRGVPSIGLKDFDTYWREELPALLATDPAVVVVALGTNDTTDAGDVDAFPARLDTMMRALGTRPVVWVTHVRVRPLEVPGGGEAVNAAIRSAPARWPNLSVLDLTPVLSDDPSLLRDDRLHFTERGMARYAAEIAAGASRAAAVAVAP